MRRPLRSDLLSRVKVQTIRVVPVHLGNVDRVVRQMIAARGMEIWHDEAKTALVTKIKEQIEKVKAAHAQWVDDPSQLPMNLPVFFHRREIGQVIDMINAYVTHSRSRGTRRADNQVMPADVEFIYRPASVLRPRESGTRGPSGSSSVQSSVWSLDDVKSLLGSTTQNWVLFQFLYERRYSRPTEHEIVEVLTAAEKWGKHKEVTKVVSALRKRLERKDLASSGFTRARLTSAWLTTHSSAALITQPGALTNI